jgi:O-succinylbenzoic acid--CoA ligase
VTLSIFDAARDAPARTALVSDAVTLTFAELAARVERRLGELNAAGALDPGGQRPVLVIAHATLPTIETLLALLAAGTPALLGHPRATAVELEALSRRAQAVPEPPRGGVATQPALGAFDPERIAVLMPTSGTTGEPRLVLLSHRALVAAARASAENLGIEDDRWLLSLPLAHVGGLGVLVRSLWNRRAVALFSVEKSLLRELDRFVVACERLRVTLVSLVPTLLERLLAPPVSWRPPASLRAVLVGGAAIPRQLIARARAVGIPALPTYGMTETCAQISTGRYAARLEPPRPGHELFPSGVPLAGTEVRLVDGLLEVRSPMLLSGYLGEPASAPRDRFFATHDRAFLDERGELTITGRASDLIITGGENVDPLEVEAALQTLPGVLLAYVFGVPDVTFGERIAALVVFDGPSPRDLETFSAGLRSRIASYKLPRLLECVPELPLTPSGKLDRRAARALFAARSKRS